MAEAPFEPMLIAFCCNWCSYTGADLAGTSRLSYPPNVRIIRVMCSGMVHPNLVMDALTHGADGVVICGCHPGDCHYLEGNLRAEKRKEAIDLMLGDFGLEPERFRLAWVSAAEGARFAEVMREMTEAVRALGPSPYRGQAGPGGAGGGDAAGREAAPGPGRDFAGRRLFRDARTYADAAEAARARTEYEQAGFEVQELAEGDGIRLFTRRAAGGPAPGGSVT